MTNQQEIGRSQQLAPDMHLKCLAMLSESREECSAPTTQAWIGSPAPLFHTITEPSFRFTWHWQAASSRRWARGKGGSERWPNDLCLWLLNPGFKNPLASGLVGECLKDAMLSQVVLMHMGGIASPQVLLFMLLWYGLQLLE